MKLLHTYKKILDAVAKVAEWIVVLAISAMVVLIVVELINRNIFGNSFLPTIEICGILFLWMAFIGLIPIYRNSGLMKLDFLVSRTKGAVREIIFFVTEIVCFGLGVIMIVAFVAQAPFVSTRTYATMPFLPYTIQYVPMAVAGLYIALETVAQTADHILEKKNGPAAAGEQEGTQTC